MDNKTRKLIKALSFSIFVFTLLGWIYVVLAALVHPDTLDMQLTHLTPFIREDTFGILCFAISFFSFLIWNLARE